MKYPWFKANENDFDFKEKTIGGDLCVLVTPKPGFNNWTEDNKFYRSSIWRVEDGHPISIGLPKFTNYEELPGFNDIKDTSQFVAVEKIDGSSLIVSRYKGENIVRTRGTFDATELDNGEEVKEFIKSLHNLNDIFANESPIVSFIFEWTSPNNQIVISHKKTEFYLIGAIVHDNFELFEQACLDFVADVKDLKRPQTFEFTEGMALDDVKKSFDDMDKSEGAVVYFDAGQTPKKMKSEWYLKLHHARSFLSSENNIIDYLWDEGLLDPTSEQSSKKACEKIEKDYDFEIRTQVEEKINHVYEAYNKVVNDYEYVKYKIESCTTEQEVLDVLKDNPAVNEGFAWIIFRNNKFKKSSIVNLLKSYLSVEESV